MLAVFFYRSRRSRVQKCLISDRLSPKMLPIWKRFLKWTWFQSWAKQTNCLTKHTQSGWLEDSQSSRYMDRLFIAYCRANVKVFTEAFPASWLTPNLSQGALICHWDHYWVYWTDKRPSWKTAEGREILQREVEWLEGNWRQHLVLTCPACSPEGQGVWRKLEKLSEVDAAAGRPPSGCFFQKAAGSGGWSVCGWRLGEQGHL